MAGGGYPVAWRGASIPLAPPGGAFTPAGRIGQVPGTFPNLKPANANAPLPRFPGIPQAFRLGARFLPLIGYGLLLWELWELYEQLAEQLGPASGPSGWTLVQDCPGARPGEPFYSYQGESPVNGCYTSQFVGVATEITSNTTYIGLWHRYAPVVNRSDLRYGWRRNVAGQGTNDLADFGAPGGPSYNPQTFPHERPWHAPFPQVLPEAAPPPGRPVPSPRPVPFPLVPYLPGRSPSGEPIRGPRPVRPVPEWPFIPGEEIEPVPGFEPLPNPVPVPVPAPGPVPVPQPGRRPGSRPSRWPSSQIEWAPGRAPRVTRRPHERRRPRDNERERKTILNVDKRHVVARAMNAASETCDVVDALYDALPEATRKAYERETWKAPSWWNHRGKGMDVPCQAKAAAVWKYFDQLDWGDAMYNLAYNQIVDFGFGKAGQAAGKVGRDIGRPVGLGTGPAL